MNPPDLSAGWRDVSVTVRTGLPVWPGNPLVDLTPVQSFPQGDEVTISKLSLGAHTGTHMDAPLHFIEAGKTIDEVPLEIGLGRARVIEIENREVITLEELERHAIEANERLLFKTHNSARDLFAKDDFTEDYVYISTEAGEYLADRRVKLVGVDYVSVGGYQKNAPEVHRALLGGGVWIVEGLDLSSTPPGEYDLLCLPLKLKGLEASPVRALLRPRG